MDDAKLDPLYKGPREEFIKLRNELAKRLRADGDKAAGDRVAKLRKPTAAAWVVNQLAARKPKQVEKLIAAGDKLRGLQEKLLAGDADADEVRKAGAAEQKAVDALLSTAKALGREHGASGQTLDRVIETLQAATVDPEVAEAIRAGRLEREQRRSSLGLGALPDSVAPAKRGRKKKEKKPSVAERRESERTERKRQQAERRIAAAEKKVARAREALEHAERELDDAKRKA